MTSEREDGDREFDPDRPARTSRAGPFQAEAERVGGDDRLRYRVRSGDAELRYADVLDLWERDPTFVDFFVSVLTDCGFPSFVWETPPLSRGTVQRAFEFVVQASPWAAGAPDRETFAAFFDAQHAEHGVIAFDNLGGDALLVVPSPLRPDADYGDLAAFHREAPPVQRRALWNAVARHTRSRLSDDPLWISVAGGGVRWLHVRLDRAPKYYRHAPYTTS